VTDKWKFLRDLTNKLSYPKQGYYYFFIIFYYFLLFVTSHDVTSGSISAYSYSNVVKSIRR